MTDPLKRLQEFGQSFWYDNIHRGLITAGGLQRLIDEDGLRGVTSNPTIFEKAIAGSADYQDAIQVLVREGLDAKALFEALSIEDIQSAADLLRPVYDGTQGADGLVSLELPPALAHDTEGSVAEAHRLFRKVDRPNVMIKVPGTREGIPAVERLISDGININITLLFSLARYEEVMEVYIRGLERRVQEDRPVDGVASVASFFVSRVDTAVDRALDALLKTTRNAGERARLEGLKGKAAIANAKLAYQRFKATFNDKRFKALEAAGARVQRPLWASTSTKNPAYRDVLYVEELIGPNTINTMPTQTIEAFRDHGRLRPSLEEDVEGARRTLKELAEVGVDMHAVTEKLQVDGVKAFGESY
ncbi:MAG: transaldolase, partial [Candidatus Methylomirabilales bacterium]